MILTGLLLALVTSIPSPAGEGAAEPFLFAARDSVLLSWLEPVAGTKKFALRWSRHRNDAWSPPKTIVERDDLFVNWADFPSIVEDKKGALFVHWLQKSAQATYAYDVWMATSTDSGATWSKPFLLNRDGKQSEHGFVSLVPLPNGGVGATWLDGRNMTGGGHGGHESGGDMTVRYANVSASGAITGDVQVDPRACECCTTGMTMTSSGPVIGYRDRTADEVRDISYVRRSGNAWTQPRAVRADGWKINACPVNGPQLDAIGKHVASAWFTAAKGKERVFVAFSGDAGETFGTAITVDDGKPLGRVDVIMLDSDTAVVSWLEATSGGAEVRIRRVRRDAKPAESIKVAQSSTARGAGVARMARVGSDVWITWTEPAGSAKRIHVARMRF